MEAAEVAGVAFVRLADQRRGAAIDDHGDDLAIGRPDAEVDAATTRVRLNFRADREAPLDSAAHSVTHWARDGARGRGRPPRVVLRFICRVVCHQRTILHAGPAAPLPAVS